MLLFADTASFVASGAQAAQGWWQAAGLSVSSSPPAGNVSSTAWTSNNTNDYQLPTAGAGPFIVGVRLYPSTFTTPLIAFLDGSKNIQCALQIDSTGHIFVYRTTSANTLGTATSVVSSATAWNYIEFKLKCDATTGTVDVHVNGVSVLSLTGQNTKGQATTSIAYVRINSGSGGTFWQDIYVGDTTGSDNNDFLGDIKVGTFRGNANGAYTDYSANGVANVWDCVDDATPNDDTDYASDATASHKMTVKGWSGTFTGDIAGIIHVSRVRKDDAGTTRQIQQVVRSGSTDSTGATQTLGTTYQYYSQVLERDPATGLPWTQSGFNASEIGIETIA